MGERTNDIIVQAKRPGLCSGRTIMEEETTQDISF
jgi:hypothetical protein